MRIGALSGINIAFFPSSMLTDSVCWQSPFLPLVADGSLWDGWLSGTRPGSTSQRSEASFHARGSARPRCTNVASLRSATYIGVAMCGTLRASDPIQLKIRYRILQDRPDSKRRGASPPPRDSRTGTKRMSGGCSARSTCKSSCRNQSTRHSAADNSDPDCNPHISCTPCSASSMTSSASTR
jgi:hypothetical protein